MTHLFFTRFRKVAMKTKSVEEIRSLVDELNGQNPTFNGEIRAVVPDGSKADDEKSYELSFSSEDPYLRWFGYEILGHAENEVRMDWISSGNAPLLLQHNHSQQIGVIVSAKIEGGRGTAVVRFGRSALAREIKQDVDDGIRTNVSVGYRVHEMKLVKEGDNGPDEYRVTDWEPFESSIVSVPADKTVGVGRAGSDVIVNHKKKENSMNLKQKARELGLSEDATPEAIIIAAEKAAGSAGKKAAEDAAKAELARRDTITALGKQHGLEADAGKFIDSEKSAEAFQQHILAKYGEGHTPLAQISDFTAKEQKDLSGFSIVRAMRLAAAGKELDGVEAEVCALGAEEASRCGIETSGERGSILVPSMLSRATALSSSTNAGGEFIPTVTSPNVIDTLRNKLIFGKLGGRIMTGLAGTLKLPKVTTSPSGTSTTEVGSLSDATIVTGELELSPHRVGATLPYSKQLFLQSSPSVDAFVADQLLMACALQADYLGINGDGTSDGHWYGILNYSGVGSVASGDNGKQADWADIVGLETAVAVANADVDNLAYLTSAKGRGMLKQTVKVSSTDSNMIWSEANMINGYKGAVSNQVPQNVTKGTETTNTTSIVFGNWNAAILGFFGGQEVIVDPYTLAKKAQVQVTVNMFADFDLEHAGSFAVMDGVHQS